MKKINNSSCHKTKEKNYRDKTQILILTKLKNTHFDKTKFMAKLKKRSSIQKNLKPQKPMICS